MITLIRWELHRFYRRLAPYYLYGALALLVTMVTWGMREFGRFASRGADAGLEVVGDTRNALMVSQGASMTVALLLLYLVPVVVGEIVGGDGATGVLRTVLVRPRRRAQIWLAKYATAWVYALSVSAALMGLSLLLGGLLFGWGKLYSAGDLHNGKLIVLTPGEGLAYVALSYALLTLSVMTAGTIAVALGSWLDNALLPGMFAVGILITLQIIAGLPYEWVEPIKPYLFTHYLMDHTKAYPSGFDPETGALQFPAAAIWPMVRVHCVTIFCFAAAGLWRFTQRDVTC